MSEFSTVANPYFGDDDDLMDAFLNDVIEPNPTKKKAKAKKTTKKKTTKKRRKGRALTASIDASSLATSILEELKKSNEVTPGYVIPKKKRRKTKKKTAKKNPVVEVLEGLGGANPSTRKRRKTRRGKVTRKNPPTGMLDPLFMAIGVAIGWGIGRLITTGLSKIRFFQTAEMTPNYFAYAAPMALPLVPPIKSTLENLTEGINLPFTWNAVFAGLGVSALFGIAKPFIANMPETSQIKGFLQTMLGQDDSSPIIIIPSGQLTGMEGPNIGDWGPGPEAGWGNEPDANWGEDFG